jgi:hypothetical protein
LKEFYRADVSIDEWALIKKLKIMFDIPWSSYGRIEVMLDAWWMHWLMNTTDDMSSGQ